jgi:hypothetical protein
LGRKKENVKIKMLTVAAGPQGNFNAGDVLEVGMDIRKEQALAFVEGGYARIVEKAGRLGLDTPSGLLDRQPARAVETAVIEPEAEKAVVAPAKKGSGRKK